MGQHIIEAKFIWQRHATLKLMLLLLGIAILASSAALLLFDRYYLMPRKIILHKLQVQNSISKPKVGSWWITNNNKVKILRQQQQHVHAFIKILEIFFHTPPGDLSLKSIVWDRNFMFSVLVPKVQQLEQQLNQWHKVSGLEKCKIISITRESAVYLAKVEC